MKHFYFVVLLLAISFGQKAQVTLVTNMPPSIAPNANLNIEVKINKGTISNFSKYEMELPEGFEASEGNSKTGYFTFEKNRAKIVWVTLPPEPEYVFSFKLKTPAATGPRVLNHKFYYIENGVKKEVNGPQIDVKVDASGVTKTLSYLPDEPEAPVVTNTVPAVVTNTVAAVTTTTLPPAQTVTVASTPTVAASGNTIVTTSTNTLSAAQTGLTYLVQIGTFGTDPGKAKYADLGKVTIEKDGTVYKVLIGEYNTKEEALKKREELVPKGYNGFLVKYQNGQRVK